MQAQQDMEISWLIFAGELDRLRTTAQLSELAFRRNESVRVKEDEVTTTQDNDVAYGRHIEVPDEFLINEDDASTSFGKYAPQNSFHSRRISEFD